jgi:prevent-host-death family protein
METVTISDLRNHLPEYLSRVEAGAEIEVRRPGTVIARIVPALDKRQAATVRLRALRGNASADDVLSPVDAD